MQALETEIWVIEVIDPSVASGWTIRSAYSSRDIYFSEAAARDGAMQIKRSLGDPVTDARPVRFTRVGPYGL